MGTVEWRAILYRGKYAASKVAYTAAVRQNLFLCSDIHGTLANGQKFKGRESASCKFVLFICDSTSGYDSHFL